MSNPTDELRTLMQQNARKPQLETRLNALRARQTELEHKLFDLEYTAQKEQADVDKLQNGSLAAFFYALTGKKGEKLEKEQAEAYAARVRYDAAAAEQAALQKDIADCRAELQQLRQNEQRYAALLAEKNAAVRASGSPAAEQLLELERQLAACKAQQRELNEAVDAGQRALCSAEDLIRLLNDADGLATWDLLGGGLLADLAKHDSLDRAQQQVNALQAQLSRFRAELADVTIRTNLSLDIGSFDRFADFFFDGLFADWNMIDKIERALGRANTARMEIRTALNRLETMLAAEQRRQQQLNAKRELLVVEAAL